MLARLTSKGQITIPKKIRTHLGVSYGDVIDFNIEKEKIIMRKKASTGSARGIRGMLSPVKHHTDDEIRKGKSKALARKWGGK